ncbi:MAG: RHS repeat-associated core domain-containing protein [bacterium]
MVNRIMKKWIVILLFFILVSSAFFVFISGAYADYTIVVWVEGYWEVHPGHWIITGMNKYYDAEGNYHEDEIWVWIDPVNVWIEGYFQYVDVPGNSSTDPANIQIPGVTVLGPLDEFPQELQDILDSIIDDVISLDQLKDDAKAIAEANINNGKDNENVNNGTPCGDPIRLATGDYVFNKEDLSYEYINNKINIKGSYQTQVMNSHSFGVGWSFNYDTRVIRGINHSAQVLYNATLQKAENVNSIYNNALSEYNSKLNSAQTIIDNAMATKQTIEATINSLQNLLQQYQNEEEIAAAIQEDLDLANLKLNQINLFIPMAINAKQGILNSYSIIEEINEIKTDLEERVEHAKKELNLSDQNEDRNAHVFNASDPEFFINTGIDTITFIDEQGISHIYSIDEEPDFDSEVYYENGQKNYYPTGSTTTALLPNDDILTLLSDGRYQLTRKDKTRYLYSFYGQLEAIVDQNNNIIDFFYNDEYELIKISDGFLRLVLLERENGRIVKVIDPKGREVSYEYNSVGQMIKVTDAEGHAISYEYDTDNYLVKIIKPDESYREYIYILIGGKKVVSETIDEEGNIEQFNYNPELKYTEYINPSGIIEKHYFSDNNLTTGIEYADGSYVLMEYDEDNNLIKKTNELGYSWHYKYDENRNLIESTDPEGYTEKWAYNEFNKISYYTDKQGYTTYYSYDLNGNKTGIAYPDNSKETFIYNDKGQLIQSLDQLNNIIYYSYDSYGYLASVTDPEGNTTEYENDIIGNVIKTKDPEGFETHFEYNNDNKVIRVIDNEGNYEANVYNNRKDLVEKSDKNGNTTTLKYDRRHLLVKEINALGEEIIYYYRLDGKMVEKIIEGKNKTTYEYDIRGNLVKEEQVETGVITQYKYDSAGQIIFEIDPKGNTTQYSYSKTGQLKSITDPEGNTEYINYNPSGQIDSKTDKLGRTTYYKYDNLDRLIKVIDPENNEIINTYNAKGNLLSIKDKNGNLTRFSYDKNGRLIQIIDALGIEEYNKYDKRGLLIERTDKNGNRYYYGYDSLERLIAKTNQLDNTRIYSYDSIGNILTMTDENSNTTIFQYDGLNRLIKKIDPYGNSTSCEYNYLGKVSKITDALGNEKGFIYDELGRLVEKKDPLGNSKKYIYDKNSNLIKILDELNRATIYSYDSLSRCISEINNLGETYTYQYDLVGNRIAEIDAKENQYSYKYDNLNRLVKEINRLNNEQTYSYDRNGNLISKTDFNGDTTINEYDALNRLIKRTFSDSTEKTFTYDPENNILSATNENNHFEYIYDELNRLARIKDITNDKEINYTYDAVGNRIRLYWLNNERTISYTYGKLNELLSVTDTEGKTTYFEYDKLLREIKEIQPNNIITQSTYDPSGRVLSIKTENIQNGPGVDKQLKSLAYIYNEAGESIYQIDNEGNITAYEYDEIGRIKNVYYPYSSDKKEIDLKERIKSGLEEAEFEPASLNIPWEIEEKIQEAYSLIAVKDPYINTNQYVWKETFVYDVNSNRLSKTNGLGTIEYSYNEENQILNSGNREYFHDLNGNLIKEQLEDIEAIYSYNPDNRIKNIYCETEGFLGENEVNVEYSYDPFLRRSSRVEYNIDNELTEVNYLYDGLGFNILADFRVTEDENQKGKFSPLSEYIYANGNLSVRTDYSYNEKIKPKDKYYHTQDILGSTILISDPNGHEKKTYSYDAFGIAYQGDLDEINEFGYNGKRYDHLAELYNYGFRDYKPEIGRWTTIDPVKDRKNWYSYCSNNPANLIDPLGLCGEENDQDLWTITIGIRGALGIGGELSTGLVINPNNFWDSGLIIEGGLGVGVEASINIPFISDWIEGLIGAAASTIDLSEDKPKSTSDIEGLSTKSTVCAGVGFSMDFESNQVTGVEVLSAGGGVYATYTEVITIGEVTETVINFILSPLIYLGMLNPLELDEK